MADKQNTTAFQVPLSILIAAIFSISPAVAEAPSVEKLWEMVTRQQAQIEQQQKQIQTQNETLESLKEQLTQGKKQAYSGTGKNPQMLAREDTDELITPTADSRRFEFEGYAVANYSHYNWDTNADKRDDADLERFVLEGKYHWNDSLFFEAEIEYEHGGTGSTMEFDVFEEFGEFEQEIEKGGEIVLEALFVQYQHKPWLGFRVGEIPVPVGLINKRHRPSDYFTTRRSEGESAMIPVNWHEMGLEIFGNIGNLKYRTQVITGLDSTGFSSANWVKRGFQKRFEKKNAENLAFVASLDYKLFRGAELGGSFYYGDTSGNRPKPDLNAHAEVMIAGLHGVYEEGPWTVRGAGLYGHLNNSDLVSAANRRLSNNLNVKRSPVAATALAWYLEAGFDLFHLLHNKSYQLGSRLDVFARYDNYNTMEDTDGLVFANSRWDRETWVTGFNYHFIKGLMLKGEFAHRRVGIKDNNKEKTYSLGVAAEF